MKKLLGFAMGASFLLIGIVAENAVAANKKVCVDVVEHTPKSKGPSIEKEETTKVGDGKNSPQKSSAEVPPKPEKEHPKADNGKQHDDATTVSSETVDETGSHSKQQPQPLDTEAKSPESAVPTPVEPLHPTSSYTGRARATFPVDPPINWMNSEEDTNIPVGQSALMYLERLLEHFVTHESGYVAVEKGCEETLNVELYPLQRGWTAFARYSGTGREERVDQLFPAELSMFSERVVIALLDDVPISATINRENVLKSDSMKSVQRVKGRSHFVLSVGAQFRVGQMPTWNDSVSSAEVDEMLRLLFPVKFSLGYRGRFESWGIEAIANLGIGTNTQVGKGASGSNINANKGHVDYGGDTGVALHFMRYFDPRGLTSFYLGSGATFEMLWFKVIEDKGSDKSTLYSGGLDVDGVFGWEFMRASAVQFFLQGELNVPAYFIRSANDEANLHTWLPGFTVKIGVVF